MTDKTAPQTFTSPTYGRLDWEQALAKMVWFMGTDKSASYEVIIGTDSQATNGTADFVSALVVHKKGRGGIYFWSRQKVEKLYSMKQRIWQEAIFSLNLAEKLVRDFAALGMFDGSISLTINPEPFGHAQGRRVDLNLEIHVDIGPNGETRAMINEIVGMIRANGFKVATKPAAWGASHVADRHV
ncbi:MAG: ribonuclease H-like YkuK family protein [Patescibacteria group bacterium]